VVNVLDPDIIVLGGGLSKISQLYDDVPPIIRRFTFARRIDVELVPACHGDSSGVRGAAWL
jgi:fructokinase